jgi:imidazolonepropionase
LDAGGGAVVPGFVDAHTHLAFLGNRDDEIERRLAGASYADIAAQGGGIVRSVTATRAASRAELAAAVTERLDEMLLCGTTSAEVKSGYLEAHVDLAGTTRSPWCRPSWARTKSPPSTGATGADTWTC